MKCYLTNAMRTKFKSERSFSMSDKGFRAADYASSALGITIFIDLDDKIPVTRCWLINTTWMQASSSSKIKKCISYLVKYIWAMAIYIFIMYNEGVVIPVSTWYHRQKEKYRIIGKNPHGLEIYQFYSYICTHAPVAQW